MDRGLKHQQIWNDRVAVAGNYRPQVYIICMWRNQLQKCIALSLDAPIAAMDFIVPGVVAAKVKYNQQNKKKGTEIDNNVYINVTGGGSNA